MVGRCSVDMNIPAANRKASKRKMVIENISDNFD
jgi:hypothetical protein